MVSAEASYQTPAATPTSDSTPHLPPLSSSPPPAASSADSCSGLGAARPVKRGRRSNSKVKTGCSNCKQRRIKCDEKRPACTQCMRSKKVCTGYPPPSRSARSAIEIRIAPKPAAVAPLRPAPPLQPPQPAAPSALANAPSATSLLLRGHTVALPPRRPNRRKRQAIPLLISPYVPTFHQPIHSLALKHPEGLYFDLFRLQTASELSGYFNSSFWTQSVLQECHSEPAIRHAVVALGALYKTLEQSYEPASALIPGAMSRLDSVMCHWQVAVREYSGACNAMLLLNGGSLSTNRTRLMASVLLACFDSFIGDHKQAIIQIQTGLSLLERIQYEQAQSQAPGPSDLLEEDLLVIFTRLAIQAKSYDMAFHFPQPYVIRLGPQGWRDPSSPVSDWGSPRTLSPYSLPHQFKSLQDARLASDKLCETLLRFIEHLQLAMAEPGYTLPPSWRQYGVAFQDQLDAWSSAFEPIFQSRLSPDIKLLEKLGIAALKMFQINTNILFLMMFCDTEVQFDAFLPHFRAIVSLGWEVVGNDEKRAAAELCSKENICCHQHGISKGALMSNKHTTHRIKPSFSADLGIVPPLFVVATKCREPTTRRQAVRLLRSSARREGMWDSELAANIGQWVMLVEESHNPFPEMNEPQYGLAEVQVTLPAKAIPEEKRIMVQNVNFDLRARYADLKVGPRAFCQGMQDKRQRGTRIKW